MIRNPFQQNWISSLAAMNGIFLRSSIRSSLPICRWSPLFQIRLRICSDSWISSWQKSRTVWTLRCTDVYWKYRYKYFPTVPVMRNDTVEECDLDLGKHHWAPGTFLVLHLLMYACLDQKLTHCLYPYWMETSRIMKKSNGILGLDILKFWNSARTLQVVTVSCKIISVNPDHHCCSVFFLVGNYALLLIELWKYQQTCFMDQYFLQNFNLCVVLFCATILLQQIVCQGECRVTCNEYVLLSSDFSFFCEQSENSLSISTLTLLLCAIEP